MSKKILQFLMVFIVCFCFPQVSLGWSHIARPGENLKQLAKKYYGSSTYSIVIRAANGFIHPDNGRLIQGERVEIPEVIYHKVKGDENWEQLADFYLGTDRRAKYLAAMNGLKIDHSLAKGQVVKIPYQLLYVLASNETLPMVAKIFLKKSFSSKWLKKYNLKKKKKYKRGSAVLVPLINIEFVKKEKKRIESMRTIESSADDRKVQIDAVAQIANLRRWFAEGNYLKIVSIAQNLIGVGKLTNPQQIGVYKYLAFAYVAFGENLLAKKAFKKALKLQPSMELSPITTSPKILMIFNIAFKEIAQKIENSKNDLAKEFQKQ